MKNQLFQRARLTTIYHVKYQSVIVDMNSSLGFGYSLITFKFRQFFYRGHHQSQKDSQELPTRCEIPRYLGLWMNREKTDFLTCGPGSGMPIVTLRVLEWAAGRWRHAAEELLGCRSLWAA